MLMKNQETKRFGRYEIVAELGRGAMGVVYKARDPQIDRLVALKTVSMLGEEGEAEAEFRQRFLNEAQAAGRLHHPGIVTVFDAGESPDGQGPYIVLEYVAGETLNRVLARQKKLPLARALQLAEEIAEALAYAHEQGVVHRDIKPANILITEDGHAKIADFGIAQLNLAHFTLPGKVMGTPAYMAPEQLTGENADGRSDLFSLGVILYTMVTGHSPFQGDSATTVCFKVVNRDPVAPSAFDLELPRGLDVVISRAIAKDPADRYQRGAEFASDLRQLQQQSLIGATTGSFSTASLLEKNLRDATLSTGFERSRLPSRGPIHETWLSKILFAAVVLLLTLAITAAIALRQAMNLQNNGGTKNQQAIAPDSSQPPTRESAAGVHARASGLSGTAASGKTSTPGRLRTPRANARAVTVEPLKQEPQLPAATLEVAVQHQFRDATLSVWIDDKLALTRDLHGGTQKHLVVFNGIRGTESESIQVPAGLHTVRVRAQSADYTVDLSRTVSANFSSGGDRTLLVTFENHNRQIRLTWQ